jgi:plasmid stabilization system protein ParE
MLKVILTKKAEASLEEIVSYYLSEHSAERATKVIDSFDDSFEKISKSPQIFPVCFDIKKPILSVRQMIVHNTFKIIFRIQKDKIQILEIFHGKRNPKLLKKN